MEKIKNYKIIHLPKAQWKGYVLPMGYTTDACYDVSVERESGGFTVRVKKKPFERPVTHSPEEYDFPDRLYQDYWTGACAWGAFVDGRLAGAVETDPEEWSNRLLVTELWVEEAYRRKGLGHALLAVAKEQARLERRRALILETQSCNVNAVDFYLREGFTLIGLDTCCYRNDDLARREVRLDMGYFPERKARLHRESLEIRPERPEEYRAVERLAQEAFWNRHRPGCVEHYLAHKLREDGSYLPQFSRVAVKDGEVLGCVMYSRGFVEAEESFREVLTFGPFCVRPDWQGCGVGEMLLKETMGLAAQAGYGGIVILGEPDYYMRFGFRRGRDFGIVTADGESPDALLAAELTPGGLEGVRGKMRWAEVLERLPEKEAEAFDRTFPPLTPLYFPKQLEGDIC